MYIMRRRELCMRVWVSAVLLWVAVSMIAMMWSWMRGGETVSSSLSVCVGLIRSFYRWGYCTCLSVITAAVCVCRQSVVNLTVALHVCRLAVVKQSRLASKQHME